MKQLRGWTTKKLSHIYRGQSKDRIVFLLSVPDKNSGLIIKLIQEYGDRLVIAYKEEAFEEVLRYQGMGAKVQSMEQSFWFYTRGIRLLTSAKMILVDNVYDFFGDLELSSDVSVIQLWHTNGSLKKFGAQVNGWSEQSEEKKEKFRKATSMFTDFVVSSRKMGKVFERAFLAEASKIRVLGSLSTDIYFKEKFKKDARIEFHARFPELDGKKIFLYAPTNREGSINKLSLGFHQMEEVLTDSTFLFVKPHPTEKKCLENFGKFAHSSADLRGISLPILLANVDVLITDYSSILFDYTLANPYGKILFYDYDLTSYQKEIGLDEEFSNDLFGKLVTTQGELMRALEEIIPQEELVENLNFVTLNKRWNEKNDGNVTQRVFQWIVQVESGMEKFREENVNENIFVEKFEDEKVTM
ncbi:MAG: CDP-glycerol glycerophosphotransferase family protein [Lactobacillales bacterium]|nr:CDP-glycerol glycerophosphotransferase family protein [Lactobacillales bacterium]